MPSAFAQRFPGRQKPLAQPPTAYTSDHQLLCCKSIDKLIAEADEPGHRLKKSLGPWSLTALGIGAIIGSGIFVLTGTAAAGEHFSAPSILHGRGVGPTPELPPHRKPRGRSDARTPAGRSLHCDFISAGGRSLQLC